MNPDALEPLTVSTETEILMDLLRELKSISEQLLPLLDLLKTPVDEEEQNMIRRLLSVMIDVEVALAQNTAWREALEARQARTEETQSAILDQLTLLNSKVEDIHNGFMPLVNPTASQAG